MKKSLLFAAGLIFLITSCKKEDEKIYKVEYSIGCTDCQVIYVSDQSGTQTTEFHQNSSWNYSFNSKKNQEVLLLAYNTSTAPQGVTATIKLNGAVLKSQTTYCAVSGLSFCADTVR